MRKISTIKLLSIAAFLLICMQGTAQTTFTYTGSLQAYTVPAGVTSIQITAEGAQGGNALYGPAPGGLGAVMIGTYAVTPGHVLDILVGGQGQSVILTAGGGGGTFVWDVTAGNTLLVAAGGGGGAGYQTGNGINAVTAINGTDDGQGDGGGGVAGNGGTTPGGSGYEGAGGAGWLSNGAPGNGGCSTAQGGSTPLSGGAGGSYGGTAGYDGNGGYGGGGGGQGICVFVGGGGGGGYSGGAGGGNFIECCSNPGGGGGSYSIGTSQSNSVGNTGNGLVAISSGTPVAATPTLSQWGLILFSLLLLSFGMVFAYRKQNAMVLAGAMVEEKPATFNRSLYIKALGAVLLIAVAGLVTTYRYFGTLTITDTLGTLASACVVAYMVQLSLLMKKK